MPALQQVTVAGAIAAAALCAPAAHAGRSCEPRPPTVQMMERGLALAEQTWRRLEAEHAARGTQVVVLARAGRDLTKYGIRYSHLGFAYRTPQGQWRVVHKLNDCGTAHAAVYRQGLGEFFLDDLWRYDAAWVVPTPALQAQLAAVLADDARAARMHHAPYSIVSYAWGTKYQQSNQWAIETLAAAAEPDAQTRERAQAWLQFKGYQPTTLKLGPLTRLGGRMTAANIAFDDHPNEKRFSDRIETVTVDSVFTWLQRGGMAGPTATLSLP